MNENKQNNTQIKYKVVTNYSKFEIPFSNWNKSPLYGRS